MKLVEFKKRQTQINLTALIDVLFLLIIFFSVSTKFANQEAVPIDLPKAKTAQGLSVQTRLVIGLKDENHLWLNGSKVTWEQLDAELANPLFDRNEKVVLNIDQKVPYGKVISLLDQLRENNFEKVAFGSESP
ncbi:MAG: biopolymer transporter ExbD [bacterium]|nr:biopolymer transporter ExbD [bacterium]